MNILVIDDSPERAWPLKLLGYNVVVAYGRDEIEDAIQAQIHWDMIFLDHDMPSFDGDQVVKEFGSYLINFPIIIWSWNEDGARRMAYDLNQIRHQEMQKDTESPGANRVFPRVRRHAFGDWVKTFNPKNWLWK